MQGFNMGRYYPPDASNPPTFNKSHPLGARANKVSQGILTVRFELPFAVWCNHCKPEAIIGQGVRFNAEKKKVGNYYSTPIWSFRMKHSACGGWWEIRTDPKATEYVVVEGARRREYGPEEKGGEGEERFLTEEERQKRREDAFASLEGKLEDKGNEKKIKERVEELYDKSEVWRNPYKVNAQLRKDFRIKRKVWEKEERQKEGMQNKFSLGIDIVDETDSDRVRAGLIDFALAEPKGKLENDVIWKPLFSTSETGTAKESTHKPKKLKSEIMAENSRRDLQQKLVRNTRASIDPFLAKDSNATSRPNFGILKRKRDSQMDSQSTIPTSNDTCNVEKALDHGIKRPTPSTALVDYDSD